LLLIGVGAEGCERFFPWPEVAAGAVVVWGKNFSGAVQEANEICAEGAGLAVKLAVFEDVGHFGLGVVVEVLRIVFLQGGADTDGAGEEPAAFLDCGLAALIEAKLIGNPALKPLLEGVLETFLGIADGNEQDKACDSHDDKHHGSEKAEPEIAGGITFAGS